jgi:hypothetical protein
MRSWTHWQIFSTNLKRGILACLERLNNRPDDTVELGYQEGDSALGQLDHLIGGRLTGRWLRQLAARHGEVQRGRSQQIRPLGNVLFAGLGKGSYSRGMRA